MLPDWVKEHLELEKKKNLYKGYAEVNSQERLDSILYSILSSVCENIAG